MSIEIKSDKEIYLTGLPATSGGGGGEKQGYVEVVGVTLGSILTTTEEQS